MLALLCFPNEQSFVNGVLEVDMKIGVTNLKADIGVSKVEKQAAGAGEDA